MEFMPKKFFIILFIFTLYAMAVFAEKTVVFEFTEEEKKLLKVRKIKKETTYTLGSNENGNYLKAETEGKASGLGIEKKINLLKQPFINITWKVEKSLSGIDEKSKNGHDYAARVFVVKKTGITPLSNKAINYVFSSNNLVDQYWRSPFTKNSIDYVLSTTQDNLNKWITVKANVKEHFKKLHNIEVNEIEGIAIMTDTDNTKLLAIAYYQNIYFSSFFGLVLNQTYIYNPPKIMFKICPCHCFVHPVLNRTKPIYIMLQKWDSK